MKKKTTILTGFLGAGKTTYLNHLIKSNPNKRFAIIENEFGEESIDGDLIVHSSDEDIVELNNGCLCCTLNENLYDILSDFHLRRDEFDELIIEATGIADPAAIAEPFFMHPAVKKTFELAHVVCIVDAEQIEDRLADTEEARKQVAFADVLLITKTDLVNSSYLLQVQETLRGINPTAVVLAKEAGVYPELRGNREDLLIQEQHQHHDAHHHHHHDNESCGHHHHEHNHSPKLSKSHQHTDIVTHSFVCHESFNVELLYHQLFVLLSLQSKDFYRLKAIVHTEDSLNKILIQSVGQRLGIEELQAWGEGEAKVSRFVIIGKNLKPESFERVLRRCVKRRIGV
jgi:G3E family GTPase